MGGDSQKKISASLKLVREFRRSRVGGDPVDAALTKLERGIQRRTPDDVSGLVEETRAALAILKAVDDDPEALYGPQRPEKVN